MEGGLLVGERRGQKRRGRAESLSLLHMLIMNLLGDMNRNITRCWDTFLLIEGSLGRCPLTETLYTLTGAMSLAWDEGREEYALSLVQKFKNLVARFAAKN
jgi:hypothetical protein